MRRVVIESPYGGDEPTRIRNVLFARACLLDSLRRGEAPIASHLLHTQVLDDNVPAERNMGISAGHAWIGQADAVVVYVDRGISAGMIIGIEKAKKQGIKVEHRRLDGYDPRMLLTLEDMRLSEGREQHHVEPQSSTDIDGI